MKLRVMMLCAVVLFGSTGAVCASSYALFYDSIVSNEYRDVVLIHDEHEGSDRRIKVYIADRMMIQPRSDGLVINLYDLKYYIKPTPGSKHLGERYFYNVGEYAIIVTDIADKLFYGDVWISPSEFLRQDRPPRRKERSTGSMIRYKVRPSDTVKGIAKLFGVEVSDILEHNLGVRDDTLDVEYLRIPSTGARLAPGFGGEE